MWETLDEWNTVCLLVYVLTYFWCYSNNGHIERKSEEMWGKNKRIKPITPCLRCQGVRGIILIANRLSGRPTVSYLLLLLQQCHGCCKILLVICSLKLKDKPWDWSGCNWTKWKRDTKKRIMRWKKQKQKQKLLLGMEVVCTATLIKQLSPAEDSSGIHSRLNSPSFNFSFFFFLSYPLSLVLYLSLSVSIFLSFPKKSPSSEC